MRLFILILTLTTSINAWSNGKAYLDIEDDQNVSVFNKPGKNWKNCFRDPTCRAVAWPNNSAQIEVTSPTRKMMVEDPYTGEVVEEEYVQINYKYRRTVNEKILIQQGSGWIDAAYVSKDKKDPFYGAATSPAANEENCPPNSKINGSPRNVQKNLGALEKTLAHKSVNEAAEMLKPLVGACVIDPSKLPAKYAPGNPFDTYVLPQLHKSKLPELMKDNGEAMTQKDLIDIDALARTLYAEMARCYKHGLHYPMTVAKIAVNRAAATGRHKEFIKPPHDENKGDLAKTVTTASQFSLWLAKIGGKKNNSLRQALCPPAEKDKKFWTGTNPPEYETDIWENTMRIATEAVLYPQQFNARTKNISQFHYTSGMRGFYGMKQVRPAIESRTVSKDACVQVWIEPSKL